MRRAIDIFGQFAESAPDIYMVEYCNVTEVLAGLLGHLAFKTERTDLLKAAGELYLNALKKRKHVLNSKRIRKPEIREYVENPFKTKEENEKLKKSCELGNLIDAYGIKEQYADYINMGVALNEAGFPEEEAEIYRAIIDIYRLLGPEEIHYLSDYIPKTYQYLANTLRELGKTEEADRVCDELETLFGRLLKSN